MTVTRKDVKKFYAEAALRPQPELCCPGGYSGADTAHIPKKVLDRAYGCGSPMGAAGVAPGETVVDLGSGAGIDVFIAAKLVGAKGRAIGVDMTPEMRAKAQAAAKTVAKALGYRNAEFRYGFLEAVPVSDAAADLVTSNCVLNLSTEKAKVFSELFRILRPGGRFVIADITARTAVPPALKADKQLWGECLTGAMTLKEFTAQARKAGFTQVEVLSKAFYKKAKGHSFDSVTVRGWKGKSGKKAKPAATACCAGTAC